MTDIWSFLLQTLTASGVAALLLVLKAMFRDKLSPRWQFSAWGVLGIILLLPAGYGGRYVLLNWPFYVELFRSALTGEYGALARVAAPVPLPALSVPQSVEEWLFTVYVFGAMLLLVRYVFSYIRLRMVLRRGRPVENGRVSAVAEQYGLPVCPAVEVEGLPSAFICGVFRPVLALPAGTEADEKVLLHELLHLKHHDAAWGLVICFFRCIHWCNPLLWYCADQAGNDLESLCDQRVLERLEGEDRRDYGRILLSMADEKYARAPGTSSMANGGKNIRRRIEAIARFKKYPAGMGLVSVCVLLALAAPLAVGARAPASNQGLAGFPAADFAYARTVYCTTYAGAFDTYAKAVMTGRFKYRVMCAPLSEQNALVEYDRSSTGGWTGGWMERERDQGLPNGIDNSCGYQIYNLAQVGENAYEGLLALTLHDLPEGVEWDGTAATRWMAVQPLRAEKEGDRWVVIPQGKLEAVQGDIRDGGNIGLPAWEYTAPAGDFTLRMRWQTASQVDSQEQVSNGFWTTSTFGTTPIPDGKFTSWFHQSTLADYTGSPENRGKYWSIGVSSMPLWGDEERPFLRTPGPAGSSGSSSTGEDWGSIALGFGFWENTIFLSGGGSQRDGLIERPAAYAADLYLNGEKTAELTLLPEKGGAGFD